MLFRSVKNVDRMFVDAVEAVNARGYDTGAMMKLCNVTKVKANTAGLPKPSLKKRKRATKAEIDGSMKSLLCFKK